MPLAHAPARDWRRITFYAVTAGAMAVSIGGQMDTVAPRIGGFLAFIFAVVNDVGAILALDCAMTAARKSAIRRWAWVAVLVAAGSGGTLNAWHAIAGVPAPAPAHFPIVLGLVVGVEPILLVLVLSHLLALVMEARRQADGTGGREVPTSVTPDRENAPARPRAAAARTASPTASLPAATASPTASFVVTTGTQAREEPAAATASSRRPAATAPPPRLHVAPDPDPDGPDGGPDRPAWMTKELIDAVVALARTAGAPRKRYGEPRLRDEMPTLPDGSPMTSYKAQEVLRYIRDRELVEAAS